MLDGVIRGTGPLLAALVMLGLTACAGLELQNARGLNPQAGAFNAGLYQEYLILSESEFAEGDYVDSDLFADRAIAAAAGSPSAPEALDARDIPGVHRGALAEARRRLLAALDATAADEAAARGQSAFDCWMQEAEENFQPEDIAACRARFAAALSLMETEIAETAAAAVTFVNFTVYFDLDSTVLKPLAISTLIDAADASDDMQASSITISGYADRSGVAGYNIALSQRRAEVIAAELKDMLGSGAPPMALRAFGETNNKVVTPDGVKEPRNRRVKIEIRR